MITQTEIQNAEQAIPEVRTQGVRVVCSYCKADLPGSDLKGKRVSHGICRPLCFEAKAMGWEEPA